MDEGATVSDTETALGERPLLSGCCTHRLVASFPREVDIPADDVKGATQAPGRLFLEAVHQVQVWGYTDLPSGLGLETVPTWWPLPICALAGIPVAYAIKRLPGSGGHVPAEGLKAGATQPNMLPGLPTSAGIAVGMGVMIVAFLRLPLSSIVIASVLSTSAGTGVDPLIIVGVVVAYLATLAIEGKLGASAAEAGGDAVET